MNKVVIVLAGALISTASFAYSINGDSDSGFVLRCKDGTTNTSVMPPNHNTAVKFCKGHGGIAPGYPRHTGGKKTMRSGTMKPNTGGAKPAAPAQDYNSSRSNS